MSEKTVEKDVEVDQQTMEVVFHLILHYFNPVLSKLTELVVHSDQFQQQIPQQNSQPAVSQRKSSFEKQLHRKRDFDWNHNDKVNSNKAAKQLQVKYLIAFQRNQWHLIYKIAKLFV